MRSRALERKEKIKWELSAKYEGQQVFYLSTYPVFQYLSHLWKKSSKIRSWLVKIGLFGFLVEVLRRFLGLAVGNVR